MLIKFTCPAVAYDCDNEPIEETDVLKSLDGLCDTEADIADYLGFPLDQLGLIDDGICFSFDDGPKTLFAAVRFRCIDGLEETQLMKLRDAVAGQLSDGYGEEGFAVSGHERVRSIGYVVERVDEAWALVAEQIDDGAAVPDIRPHPLLRAAEEGDLERVRELLRGVKRDAMPLSRFGASPLTLAAGAGQTEVVRELLNAGFASLDATGAMRHAAQRGDMEMLSLLLDHGAPPDGSPADATAGVPGRHEDSTPLMWAASRQKLDAVKLLVERGADPNRQTAHGSTPLMYAQSAEIVHFLVAAGADVSIRDNDGESALDNARRQLDFNSHPVAGWEPGRKLWQAVVDALMQYEP